MLGPVIGDILQPTHLLFVLVVALLVLGPKRLPEVGRSLGKGLRDFRGALSGDDRDEPAIQEHHTPAPAPVAATAPVAEAPAPVTETHSAAEAVHPTSVETPSGEQVEQHVG
jgi:sec-independent protein translocase protein TatA